jgi:hypothetical protein
MTRIQVLGEQRNRKAAGKFKKEKSSHTTTSKFNSNRKVT